MVAEAMEEVACKGWKNASQKAVTLASFGMIKTQLNGAARPFWWLAGAIGTAAVWQIVSGVLSL